LSVHDVHETEPNKKVNHEQAVMLENDVEWIAGLAIWILIVSFVLYFLPTMIAVARKHRNALPIFILNLFLGWTFLGWIVSLVWCFTAQDRDQNQRA
jgi:hypothetical protein